MIPGEALVVAAGLTPRQPPQKDVSNVPSPIDDRKREHDFAVKSVEEPPRSDYYFSIAPYAMALEFRHNASGPWMLLQLLDGSIHTLDERLCSTWRVLGDEDGDVGEVFDRRRSPPNRAHRSSMACNAPSIASSWDSVAPVSTSCSPCASSFRIPIASIISW